MSRPHVLIVDDDEAMNESLAHFLEGEGFSVSCASSANAALQALTSTQAATPDVVITDVYMPETTGAQLLARLWLMQSPVRVIVMTGAASEPLRDVVTALGAAAVLEKPFAPEVLLDALDGICGTRS